MRPITNMDWVLEDSMKRGKVIAHVKLEKPLPNGHDPVLQLRWHENKRLLGYDYYLVVLDNTTQSPVAISALSYEKGSGYRAHFPGPVVVGGIGLGTVGYYGLALAAFNELRQTDIVSNPKDRTPDATVWWEKQRHKDLTYKVGKLDVLDYKVARDNLRFTMK